VLVSKTKKEEDGQTKKGSQGREYEAKKEASEMELLRRGLGKTSVNSKVNLQAVMDKEKRCPAWAKAEGRNVHPSKKKETLQEVCDRSWRWPNISRS